MRRRHLARLGLVACCIVTGLVVVPDIEAQPSSEEPGAILGLKPGARVRITTSLPEPVVGWVDALESDTIRLVEETHHTLVSIHHDAIRLIERSRVRRPPGRQAGPGLIAGGLLGLVVGVVTTENAEDVDCDPGNPFCFDLDLPSNKVMAGLAGFTIGMVGGGLISWVVIPGESWEDAARPILMFEGDGRGVQLGLTLPLEPGRRR